MGLNYYLFEAARARGHSFEGGVPTAAIFLWIQYIFQNLTDYMQTNRNSLGAEE